MILDQTTSTPTTNDLPTRKRRIAWRAKRGLLELDCLLSPFIAAHLDGLSEEDTAELERLIAMEDPDLFQVLLDKDPAHPQSAMIARIVG